jgi:F-type H+-transporting ATPase subunit delta
VTGASRALARRYARALLAVTVERSLDAEALRRELRVLVELVTRPELAAVLAHPAVPLEGKKKVLAALWEKVRPADTLRRLSDLLVERDRLTLLPGIAEVYTELWNERRGVVAAEAVTALELSPEQKEALAATLQKVTGRSVELTSRVEPEILGGLLVRMDGKTYDGTVRGRLRALRERLVI